MSIKHWLRKLKTASSTLVLLLAWAPSSFAQQACLGQPCCAPADCSCKPGCNVWNCPPPYKYCMESPPCICVICACPKPVCCPADAPNWGYFQTCWRPYPWGPNWSHCYGVPPAAQVALPVAGMPAQPGADQLIQPSASRPAMPASLARPGS
jgi:hypothetical protein